MLIFEKNLYVSYTMIWRDFLEVNRASGGLDDRKAIKGGEQGQLTIYVDGMQVQR